MADEPKTPETPEDDELLLDKPLDPDAPPADDDDAPAGDDEETILTFGDDSEPREDDTNLVKHLRAQIRERDKRLAETARARPEPVEVGPKPKLADFDYDEDKYETALDEWKERGAQAKAQQGQSQQAETAAREEWEAELNRYNEAKGKLGFADVDDAEETIKASLNTVQQAVLVKAADDPAKVMYALAKHPDRLAAIAAIHDPLKLAAALAKLEGTLKMVKRRKPPEPDTPERGSAKMSYTKDKTLAKLEAEAERTGDRTKVVAHKKRLKDAAAMR
jgi:hypothetical protein